MTHSLPPKPTESELEILQVLWQHGPCTVRFVHEYLLTRKKADETPVGYTTTLKLMQIMAEKGLVSRNEDNRTHIYQAHATEEETQKNLLNRFLDTAFRGSAMKLVMQALGNHQTSQEELNQIRHLIDQMEGGKKP